jgi:rhodanese-related sulfurtransferase
MPRRNRGRAYLFPILRKPAMQLAIVVFIGFIIYLIALAGGEMKAASPSNEVNVDEAYQMYQNGAFLLDVRTQQEWDEYHAPNSTSIPLDQLPGRLNELPKDGAILVVCNSAACSQQGRDMLLSAGFNASNLKDGFDIWYTRGYPIQGAPPQ